MHLTSVHVDTTASRSYPDFLLNFEGVFYLVLTSNLKRLSAAPPPSPAIMDFPLVEHAVDRILSDGLLVFVMFSSGNFLEIGISTPGPDGPSGVTIANGEPWEWDADWERSHTVRLSL